MDLAYIVYLSLFLVMFLFARYEVHLAKTDSINKEILKNYLTLLPILIFTLIIGLRYNVGIDYSFYKKNYLTILHGSYNLGQSFEIGYLFMFDFFAWLKASYVFPFLFTAFFQIFFLYYQSRRNIFLFPFIIFYFFFTTNFMYSLNIMRQMLAFNILFSGTRYIIDKKIFGWLAFCFIASLFHITALIAIPFYFMNRNPIRKKYVMIVFLICIYSLTNYLFTRYFNDFFEKYLPFIFPNRGIDSISLEDRNIKESSGSGIFDLVTFFVYILFINYYKICNKLYSKYGFTLFFNLSTIGIILFPLVKYNILLDRINYYFIGFSFVVFAFYTHYFLILKKNFFLSFFIVCYMFVLIAQFILMINARSNGISPFQFVTDF